MISFYQYPQQSFKSPRRVQVRTLLRSRENQRQKFQKAQQQNKDYQRRLKETQKQLQQKDQQIRELQAQNQQLKEQLAQKKTCCGLCELKDDPPIGSHGYGPKIIFLAVQLVQLGIPLRAVPKVLDLFFNTARLDIKVPHWTSLRTWLQRLGCALLDSSKLLTGLDIWFVDHSVQIGNQKMLLVLAANSKLLPKKGEPLQFKDVHPIALVVKDHWDKEQVHEVFKDLSETHAVPRAIVTDHGSDLHGGVQLFLKDNPQTIELYDFKHKAASLLKSRLNKNDRFSKFNAQIGKTRSKIQQTEMGFLTPPAKRQKARFMNLGIFLSWAKKMLRLLDKPAAKTRSFVRENGLEEKLGWLREYSKDLEVWSSYQEIIDFGVSFINERGIYSGASSELREALGIFEDPLVWSFQSEVVGFVKSEEEKLKEGERLPLSTEIAESGFSLLKRLEGQQKRNGFSGLVLAWVALLGCLDSDEILELLKVTPVKAVRQWVKKNLGTTFASKKRIAYQESRETIAPQPIPKKTQNTEKNDTKAQRAGATNSSLPP